VGLGFDIVGAIVLIWFAVLPFKFKVKPNGDIDYDFASNDQGKRYNRARRYWRPLAFVLLSLGVCLQITATWVK